MTTGRSRGTSRSRAGETTRPQGAFRELDNSRWNRLRTPAGLAGVVGFALIVVFVGPVVVWFVDDGRGIIPLVLVASVFLAWFLLRRTVRLVADSPAGDLDERLITIRNRAYVSAYWAVAGVMLAIVSALLLWSIVSIRAGVPSLTMTLTWPQVNAVLWFVVSLVLFMPSLVLALSMAQRKVQL